MELLLILQILSRLLNSVLLIKNQDREAWAFLTQSADHIFYIARLQNKNTLYSQSESYIVFLSFPVVDLKANTLPTIH